MSLTRVTSYATVFEGDQHFADKLHTWAWDESTQDQQLRALAESTQLINNLRFRGFKTSDTQVNAFPRNTIPGMTDDTTPDAIKRACIEVAYSLLAGEASEERYEDLTVSQEGLNSYGGTRVTYSRGSLPPFLAAGIPSKQAWVLLMPYFARTKDIKTSRVS